MNSRSKKKQTFRETLSLYRKVAKWNGESVTDLQKTIHRLMPSAYGIFLRLLPIALHRLRVPRMLRFDFSEIREPILAVDKKGFALVGTLHSLKVQKLAII